MPRWFSRGQKAPEYTGVNDRRQQSIIDGLRAVDDLRSRGIENAEADSRERDVRVAVERAAVHVQLLSGVPEKQEYWHAGRGIDEDAKGIWFQPNHWQYSDGRLHVGDRQWEVLGELTGQSGTKFGSSIGEQRDTLFELVAKSADRFRVNAPDAPDHRLPIEDRHFVDPGDVHEAAFSHRVNNVWLQQNFGAVVQGLRSEGVVTDRTARQLLEKSPKDRESMERWAGELAAGEMTEGVYHRLADRPDSLELDRTDTAVKGFLDDLAVQSGTDSATFLNQVQVAPPAQKSWQIAGSLMENSALRDLDPEKYLQAKEKLSVVVDEQAWTLTTASQPTHAASSQVITAFKSLEAEAVPSPRTAPQERFIDPRAGVAEPGSASAVPATGDGSAPRSDHPQSRNQGQHLGS